VNDYFASTLSEPAAASSGSADSNKTEAETVDSEPHRVRVLSWNIDGLDHNSIDLRTKAVCQIIDKWEAASFLYDLFFVLVATVVIQSWTIYVEFWRLVDWLLLWEQ